METGSSRSGHKDLPMDDALAFTRVGHGFEVDLSELDTVVSAALRDDHAAAT
jgi:hypothetical protein